MKLQLLSTKGKSKPKKAISWPTDRKYRKHSRLVESMDDLWEGLLNDVPENKRSDTLDRSVSKERRYDMEGIKNRQ